MKTSERTNMDCAEMVFRTDGIIQTTIRKDASVDLETAKELLQSYIQLAQGKKVPHLMVLSDFSLADKSVLEYMAKEANQYGKADAIVVRSMAQRILGNFYLKFQRPSIPTRLFNSIEEAEKWLLNYVD